MDEAMKDALVEYGRTIQRDEWQVGKPLIEKHLFKFKEFKKWARALAIMLRTKELLEEEN